MKRWQVAIKKAIKKMVNGYRRGGLRLLQKTKLSTIAIVVAEAG